MTDDGRTRLGGFKLYQWIAAVMMFAMAAIAFINVVSRAFVNFSFAATEEITINLFVWTTMVGTAIAFEQGGHLGMVTFYKWFPRKMKIAVVIFGSLLNAFLFAAVDIFLIQAIYDEVTLFHAKSPAFGLPVWIYYAGVLVLSVYVFRGIYRHNVKRLRTIEQGLG